jgi:hypothetical protein
MAIPASLGVSHFPAYNIQMTRKELAFAVFCIENIAEKLELTGDEAYKLLAEKSDIMDNYIIPCFDALHTQGKEYIVNELIEVIQEKGLVA